MTGPRGVAGPTAATAARARPLGPHPATWPGWLVAVGIWLVARAATAVATLVIARGQVENLWTSASPAYLDFVNIWDARWYQQIAEGGYPLPLPLGEDGQPGQSPWAFFPAYPVLVRGVMEVTRLDWRVAAPATSLVLGCVAAAFAYLLFRTRVSRASALAGVAVLAVFPSAAVLQYDYGDVLSVAALVAALYLLASRHYLWAVLPAVVLGLSRPVGLPFVLVVALHLVLRWKERRSDPFPARERLSVLGLVVAALVGALTFPLAVGVAAGRVDGYTAVQDAWRSGDGVEYFRPWWEIARWLFGDVTGGLLLGLLVVATVALLAGRPLRRLGPEMWGWCAAYALYLAAVVEPYSSVVRQLLLFIPVALVAAVAAGRSGRPRWLPLVALVLALFALQVLWIDVLWLFDPPTDPPP